MQRRMNTAYESLDHEKMLEAIRAYEAFMNLEATTHAPETLLKIYLVENRRAIRDSQKTQKQQRKALIASMRKPRM